MVPYLFWEFIILIAGVWTMTMLFFIYGWILVKRQRTLIQRIEQLCQPQNTHTPESKETTTQTEPQNITISRDEPLSKYKDMTPSEDTIVSFVDKSE